MAARHDPPALRESTTPRARRTLAKPEPASVAEVDRLLTPEEIAAHPGDPSSPAPPPGRVATPDARSLRRSRPGGDDFVLIYRVKCAVVVRSGQVGLHGAWEVVNYPTPGAASNGYTRRCAKLCADGFEDF